MVKKRSARGVRHIVSIGDTHFVDAMALLGPSGVRLKDGSTIKPSRFQRRLWAMFEEFMYEFVPWATGGEPYWLVHNGDVIEGDHHGAVHPLTRDLGVQRDTAVDHLRPFVDRAAAFYLVSGTDAHDGIECADADTIGRLLGAVREHKGSGRYARWELWKQLGPYVVHFRHHPKGGSSSGVASTAVYREYATYCQYAAQWGRRQPDCLIRSHWHTADEIRIPTNRGDAVMAVLPCWQAPTPHAHKKGFLLPRFGGMVLTAGDKGIEIKKRIWTMRPAPAE